MKKIMMILPVLALMSGCKTETYELVIPMSGINVTSPADGASVDLNDMDLDIVTFSWDQAQEAGATLIFSAAKNLKTSVTIDAGKGVSYDVTPMDLNTIASQLGIVAGSSGMLYWTVKSSDNMAAAASSVHTINVSRIVSKLRTPADQSVLELLVDEPEAETTFSWDGEGQEGTNYSIEFSTDANMTGAFSIDGLTTSSASVSLTADQVQTVIEQFDITRFSQNTFYWNVKNNTSGDYVSRASGVVNIKDMLRFTDVRGENGGEVNQYRVAKLEYNGKTVYWLAENFRSAYAADGTPLTRGTEYQTLAENDPDWCSTPEEKAAARKAYGNYYTLDAALKACPEGWKLPTYDDWRELYDAAGVAGSYIVLKSPDYYKPQDAVAEKANEFWGAWGLNLVSAGQWWGNGNPADLTNDNSEHIYSLADEMPDGNCVFVQSAAGTQFWPQDSAGAPVRYYYTGK